MPLANSQLFTGVMQMNSPREYSSFGKNSPLQPIISLSRQFTKLSSPFVPYSCRLYSTNSINVKSFISLSSSINYLQRAFMKEYVTPGAPLSLQEVQRRVMDVFRAFDKVNKENLALNASFTAELGLDSLDMVEVVIAVEEDFNLEVPDQVADEFKCPNDIVKFMYEQCGDYDVPEAELQKMSKDH